MGIFLKGFCSVGLLFFLYSKTSQDGSIRVIIYGYEHAQGMMRVALFNTADHFPDKPFKAVAKPADPDSTAVVFDSIPAGSYAIAVFLDTNGNKKLDKHLLGWPKEPYGFSNNHMQGKLSPPAFDESAFKLSAAAQTIRIQLQ